MLQSWLTQLAPMDLIVASVDVALGLAAVAWLLVVSVRSIHDRRHDDEIKYRPRNRSSGCAIAQDAHAAAEAQSLLFRTTADEPTRASSPPPPWNRS
jgi:hypothetical protein